MFFTHRVEKLYIHSSHFGLVGVSGGVGYASLSESSRSEGRFFADNLIEPFSTTEIVLACFAELVSSRLGGMLLPLISMGEGKGLSAFHSGDRHLCDRGSVLNRLV